MAGLDWIFIAAILASVGLGVWRGFVYEVMSVLNWLLAFVLAQWLGGYAGEHLPIAVESETLRQMAGFVLVFVASVFLGGLLVWVLPKLIESAGLRPVDRVLGGVFGVLRAAILLLALAVVVQMTPLRGHAWWHDSLVAEALMAGLKNLKPVLPEGVRMYLP
jgi:membrane protein required for colicin V production